MTHGSQHIKYNKDTLFIIELQASSPQRDNSRSRKHASIDQLLLLFTLLRVNKNNENYQQFINAVDHGNIK